MNSVNRSQSIDVTNLITWLTVTAISVGLASKIIALFI
jgi:hypothetical protein